MQQHFIKGTVMRVCGGSTEVHGFQPNELVKVLYAHPEPELSEVAMCQALNRNHQEILIIDEVEDL